MGGKVGGQCVYLDEEGLWLCLGHAQSNQEVHPAGKRVSLMLLPNSGLWETAPPRAQVDRVPGGLASFSASRVDSILP